MKKFNSWLNESKIEDKNIIKELDITSSLQNINRLPSLEKTPFRKLGNAVDNYEKDNAIDNDEKGVFGAAIEDLKNKHISNNESLTKNKKEHRSMLLNCLTLIHYPTVKDFMDDWNFVKNHISPEQFKSSDTPNNVDNPEKLDNFAKDNLNVDRK